MPIERKDRSFDKIFDEVTLEKIPMDYIKSVRIMLSDGSQIDMSKSELENLNSEHDILRRFENDGVLDVAITLDYQAIKEDVGADVKSLLNGFFKDGQDATN